VRGVAGPGRIAPRSPSPYSDAMTDRVICFIDSSNIFSHMRDEFGSGYYNQDALCLELAAGRNLLEWRFYAAPVPEGESDGQKRRYAAQQSFFTFVRAQPRAVLCLGRFKTIGPGKLAEKGVDVLLAIDLVRLAAEDRYDTAILLSSDEDFVPAIDAARQLYRKRVEVALPEVPAHHVRAAADGFIEITRGTFEKVRL